SDYTAPALLMSEMTPEAQPREQVFELLNQSDEPWTIKVLRASCYCVGMSLGEEEKALKVGEVFSLAPRERKSGKLFFRPTLKPETQSQSGAFEATGPHGETQTLVVKMVVPVVADVAANPPVLAHA